MSLPIIEYYRLLERYLRPQLRMVGLLAACIFVGVGLQLWLPQIVRIFIDVASAGADSATLLRVGLYYLAVTLVNQAVRLGAAYLTEDVKWRATNWLRNDLAAHCMRLDMSFHHDMTPGAMIERIDTDVNKLAEFFSQFVLRLFANTLLMLGVLYMLTRVDWRIGLAFTVSSLFTFFVLIGTVRLGAGFFVKEREASAQLYGGLEEWLAGTEDIRANGGVDYVLDRMRRFVYNVFIASRRAYTMGTLNWGVTSLLFTLNLALALSLGVIFLRAGEITIGTVYLIVSYSNTLQRPVTQLARQFQDMQAATASIMRIRELFALESAVKAPTHPAYVTPGALSVAFDDVSFGYAGDTPVLRHVDFHLPAGKVMGLLGRTGSGKSTITRLLFRFYDPEGGAVCLGGHDLRDLTVDDVRRSVGMVTQDVQIFQASVRDNLTFFNYNIPDETIIEAIHTLGLTRWFEGLPNGLDTRLDSGGRSLSAGEAQLLAFTRVFLKDPGLVILDEASSRLDPLTERLIEQAITRLLRGRTAIIVAHRLATVQRADQILVLGDGQVLESGDRVALAAQPDSRFSQLMRTGMAEALA
jgi:ATP-binding cassette subfamily B protein